MCHALHPSFVLGRPKHGHYLSLPPSSQVTQASLTKHLVELIQRSPGVWLNPYKGPSAWLRPDFPRTHEVQAHPFSQLKHAKIYYHLLGLRITCLGQSATKLQMALIRNRLDMALGFISLAPSPN